MVMKVLESGEHDPTSCRKTIVLVWQNPVFRRFVKVAQVDALDGGQIFSLQQGATLMTPSMLSAADRVLLSRASGGGREVTQLELVRLGDSKWWICARNLAEMY